MQQTKYKDYCIHTSTSVFEGEKDHHDIYWKTMYIASINGKIENAKSYCRKHIGYLAADPNFGSALR